MQKEILNFVLKENMPYKNKKKKSLLTDLTRYREGEMTGEERNSFERELQKDPFAEEATEGFSNISADVAKEDISILQNRLGKKLNLRSRIVFYRIAAAVAVLMVVSAIFLITRRKNPVITLSENISQVVKVPVSSLVPEALPKPVVKAPDKKQVVPPPAPQKSKADDQPVNIKVVEVHVAEPQQPIIKDSEVTEPDLSIINTDEVTVITYATERRMDMARAAGAPASSKSEKARDYMPPLPVAGRDSFDIYLEKNIHNPEPEKSIQQIVTVSFKVHIDSTIADIKIISSPGQAFSREAIRLIKEGPVWKPAEEDGKIIEYEVRVRIVFK